VVQRSAEADTGADLTSGSAQVDRRKTMKKWTPVVVLFVLAAALTIGCSQEQQAETEAPPAVEETADASVEDAVEAVEEAVEEVGEEVGEAVEETVKDTE